MSRNAFIVIILSVMVMGLIVVVTLLPGKQGSAPTSGPAQGQSTGQGGPLMSFDSAEARRIEIAHQSRTLSIVRRDTGAFSGAWVLESSDGAWPVEPGAVRSVLGVLSDLQPIEGAEAPANIPDGAPGVTVHLTDGTTKSVRFSPTGVGGMIGVVSSSGARGMVEMRTRDAIFEPGPEGWRMMSPFPTIPVRDASRIRLESPDSTIQLARLDGRWVMTEPLSGRCDENAVTRLLTTLADARISAFLSEPNRDASAQRLGIGLEQDIRRTDTSGRVNVETRRQALYIRGSADPRGTTLFASPTESGPSLFTVPASLPTSIPSAPRAFLSPFATGVPAEEIAMIHLRHADGRDEAVRLRLGEWVTLPDHVPADQQACAEAIEFLTRTPGEPQESLRGDDIRTVARLELYSVTSQPLDVLSVGYTSDGQFVLRSGQVMWIHPSRSIPELFSLIPFDDLPPPRPEPVTPPAPSGPNAPSK